MTKILLVEDDKSLREIYGVRLLAEGYDIVSAGDGEEALAMAIKDRPDLIVSDVMMPKISGFDMLDILRSTSETKNIKVIMMTALSSEDQRERGESLGADKYLVKSQVGIEDVVRAVHEILGDGQQKPNGATTSDSQQSQPQPSQPPATPGDSQQIAEDTQQAQHNFLQQSESDDKEDSMPQPTAPFSSQRPNTLGERVINPISTPEPNGGDISERIDEELNSTDPSAGDQSQPQTAQQPEQQPQPEVEQQPTNPQAPQQPEQQVQTPQQPEQQVQTAQQPEQQPQPEVEQQPTNPQAPQQPEQQVQTPQQPEQQQVPRGGGAQPYTPPDRPQ